MKVLIYTPYWLMGGIEKVIQILVQQFYQHGDNDQFIILTESPYDPTNQLRLSANTQVYHRKHAPFNENARLRFRGFVYDHDPDVVVAMCASRQMYKASRALVETPYPVILSEHNADDIIVKDFRSDWRFYNAVRNSADICHVLSLGFAFNFDNGVDVRIIGNPVLPVAETVSAETLATAQTIICTSRYHWGQKQPDILVRAFAEVAHEFPGWKLRFYGSDWNGGKAKLVSLVANLGIQSQVEINDATDDVPAALREASIFAFPSAYEGFSLGFFEGMAHGLPCVAMNFVGLPDIVRPGEDAVIVPGGVRNVHGLAEALRSLMADPALRCRYSQAGLKLVANEELSVETFYKRWRSMLEDAAAMKGSNRLAHPSVMERAYIENMVSGLLFDQLASAQNEARQFAKAKSILKRFHLLRFAKRLGLKLT